MCQKFFPDTRVIIISRIFGALLRTEFEGKKEKKANFSHMKVIGKKSLGLGYKCKNEANLI